MLTLLKWVLMLVSINAYAATLDSRGFPMQPGTAPTVLDSRGFPVQPGTQNAVLPDRSRFEHHRNREHRRFHTPNVIFFNSGSHYSSSISDVIQMPTTIPDGTWIKANNGNIPDRAIIYQFENNQAMYYCRAWINGNMENGVLIAQDGCYIQGNSDNNAVRFNAYEVLVANFY